MKTRFCPSPTGYLHLGNIRTALFNALLAKQQGGVFLLRIEDTDQLRSQHDYTSGLLEDLRWLGLQWDEGPEVGGQHQPYWQSERQAIYDRYYQQLIAQALVYPCFCTEQELAISRKVQLASGKPPRYSGTCRKLSAAAREEKLASGLAPTIRFHVPTGQLIQFQDLVHGEQRFQSDDVGDFIIRRADGTASFIFCNAIDDALMGVTHALRGEDHLTNTPRQLLIFQALGLPAPQYGHIALIVGHDGSPLSKRHGSRNIRELRAAGFLPEAIVNYLARLGHYYVDHHYMDLGQLATHFNLNALGTAPAHYDDAQLLHWQHEAVAQLATDKLHAWLKPAITQPIPDTQFDTFAETIRHNIAFPHQAQHYAERFFGDLPLLDPEIILQIRTAGWRYFATAVDAVTEYGLDFKKITDSLKQTLGVKGKTLFQPLRLALTAEMHGPELAHIIELLGLDKVRQRLQAAAVLCEQ